MRYSTTTDPLYHVSSYANLVTNFDTYRDQTLWDFILQRSNIFNLQTKITYRHISEPSTNYCAPMKIIQIMIIIMIVL